MDRKARWALVHGVSKSRTQLTLLSTHTLVQTDPRRLCCPLSTMHGHSEKSATYSLEDSLYGNLITLTPDLRLLGSGIMRNKCMLFVSHPVHGTLLWQPDQLKQSVKILHMLCCIIHNIFLFGLS